jgi:hypothetical protein
MHLNPQDWRESLLQFIVDRLSGERMKLLVALLLLSSVIAVAQPATTTDFDKLVDQFFDGYFSFNPTQGTAAGFHQYET